MKNGLSVVGGALLVLLSILAAGCDMSSISPGAAGFGALTPEDAAREVHQHGGFGGPNSAAAGQNFKLVGLRTWGNRAIVISTDTNTMPSMPGPPASVQTPTTQSLFINRVVKDSTGWVSFGGTEDYTGVSPLSSFVCPGAETETDSMGNYTAVYGRVRLPDVAKVEVEFSNGLTLTDTTADGIFAVMVPLQQDATVLVVKDSAGQTLQSVSIPPISTWTAHWSGGGSGTTESGSGWGELCNP